MRIGAFVENGRGGGDVERYVATVRKMAGAGFGSIWSPHVFGLDALTALAVAGREVPGVELGTAVVPIFGRHPMALAQQALTTDAAVGPGRLTLGIGLSHQVVVETMWGYSFDRPARRMGEYLDALLPLLGDHRVDVERETVTARGEIRITANAGDVPVVVAALGTRMLAIAGSRTDGTITWMTGPQTVADHIAPTIAKAAADAGRTAAPRVVVALPVSVTDDAAGAREQAATLFQMYGALPSYRAMLDREGAAGPADVAIVGDAAAVRAGIARVEDAGATEFVFAPFGDVDRTVEVVAGLL